VAGRLVIWNPNADVPAALQALGWAACLAAPGQMALDRCGWAGVVIFSILVPMPVPFQPGRCAINGGALLPSILEAAPCWVVERLTKGLPAGGPAERACSDVFQPAAKRAGSASRGL